MSLRGGVCTTAEAYAAEWALPGWPQIGQAFETVHDIADYVNVAAEMVGRPSPVRAVRTLTANSKALGVCYEDGAALAFRPDRGFNEIVVLHELAHALNAQEAINTVVDSAHGGTWREWYTRLVLEMLGPTWRDSLERRLGLDNPAGLVL